ncbi:MAG: hypothetical protein Ta2A_27320 [Treponemataceae bacterium]|nr:MAG: hypothetical protein Ta2A_27320 [Treponemataceae bacterium]
MQKKLLGALLLALTLCACGSKGAPPEQIREPAGKTASMYAATISAVVDGDTLKIKFDDARPAGCAVQETVRLVGVNTPELYHEPPEYYAQEARDYTNQWWKTCVKIELDTVSAMRDKYGRLLAYVYVQNYSAPLNLLLIKNGFGRYYGNFAFMSERMTTFARAEQKAKTAKLGLWKRG